MNELVQAIYEILYAETGADETLEGLRILRDEHEELATANCGILRNREVTIEQAHQYKIVQGFIDLYISVNVSRKAGAELTWYNAEVLAESWARKVERVLLNNATLISTTYTSGLTAQGEETEISEKDYKYRIIQSANFVVCKMTLRATYIYRNGVISLG